MSTDPRRASRAHCPDPTVVDASLHLLADGILTSLVDGAFPPSLLNVSPADDGVDLGTRPLDGAHPSELLLGFTAPDDWHALGIATAGWAYPTEQRGRPDRDRTRVHLVTMVSRAGEIAHRTHVDDPDLHAELDRETPGGEQVDLLHRALGLPTDAPPCDADVYWAIEWLIGVLNAGDVRTFDDALALHPAMMLLASGGTSVPQGEVVEAIEAFARVSDWRRLRGLVADGRFPAPELAPEDATWLDDGSFARFLLSRCPPLRELRHHVDTQLRRRVARPIGELLDELGLPATSWPDGQAA